MAEYCYWSYLAKLGRALTAVALSLHSGALFKKSVVVASTHTSLTLDWSEWDNVSDAERLAVPNGISLDVGTKGGEDGKGCRRQGKSLRQFVGDCVRLLQLPGVSCDHLMYDNGYRMPFMDADNLSCGFQTHMERGTLQDLASRYVFYFIGDSTTRRLAESFVSILTGQPSTHPVVHGGIDMSSGRLKVIFHWAPYCGDVGSAIQASINEIVAGQLRNGDARPIIITAFGVHNAHKLYGEEAGTPSPFTAPASNDTIREEDAEATALNACEKVTSQLVDVANLKLYRPGHRGLDVVDDGDTTPSRRRGMWTGGGDVSLSVGDEGLPPLVFLLQNNHYLPGSEKDRFLEQLHDVQDRVVREAKDTTGYGEDAGVFVLDDRDCLYKPMSCYRVGDSIHFHEPVKLVEGYMLWHLLALVDTWSC